MNELRFRTVGKAFYMQRRAGYFDRMERWAKVLTLFLASGAVASAMGAFGTELGPLKVSIGVLLAFVQACSLAFDFSGSARHYQRQYQRYTDAAADAEEEGLTSDQARALRRKLVSIEQEDRPIMNYVAAKAFNDFASATGSTRRIRLERRQSAWSWLLVGQDMATLPQYDVQPIKA